MPLSWVIKKIIFWFWESPTTGWHACKVKKHFHCLIICIYFYLAQLLTNDSFKDYFFQIPPLHDVILQWLVRWVSFSLHHACNAWWSSVYDSIAALCTELPGKPIFHLQKQHLCLVPTVSPNPIFVQILINRSYLDSLNGKKLHEIRFGQIRFELHSYVVFNPI